MFSKIAVTRFSLQPSRHGLPSECQRFRVFTEFRQFGKQQQCFSHFRHSFLSRTLWESHLLPWVLNLVLFHTHSNLHESPGKLFHRVPFLQLPILSKGYASPKCTKMSPTMNFEFNGTDLISFLIIIPCKSNRSIIPVTTQTRLYWRLFFLGWVR